MVVVKAQKGRVDEEGDKLILGFKRSSMAFIALEKAFRGSVEMFKFTLRGDKINSSTAIFVREAK